MEITIDVFTVVHLLNTKWEVNKSFGNQSLYALGTPVLGSRAAVPGFYCSKQQFNCPLNNVALPSHSGNSFQLQIGLKYEFYIPLKIYSVSSKAQSWN